MKNTKPVALVTGAASGIGSSAAVALAKAGYDVVINYSRSEDAAKATAAAAQQECRSKNRSKYLPLSACWVTGLLVKPCALVVLAVASWLSPPQYASNPTQQGSVTTK